MDEQMIEQIARALCAANFAKQGAEGEFGTVDDCWFAWVDEARAAHSVIAGKVAELTDDTNVRAKTAFAIRDALIDQDVHLSPPQMLYVALKALDAVSAALAPYPERRSEP